MAAGGENGVRRCRAGSVSGLVCATSDIGLARGDHTMALAAKSPIRLIKKLGVAAALSAGLCQASLAQQAPAADGPTTLFQNVRIFDGKNTALSAASNVLVRGNKIESI